MFSSGAGYKADTDCIFSLMVSTGAAQIVPERALSSYGRSPLTSVPISIRRPANL